MTGMTLSRTLSEIAALGQKAARGAGCPWGLAEEAGLAARVAESHDLPGVAALADLLRRPRACRCTGLTDGPACGIAALASLSDKLEGLREGGVAEIGSVRGALLLAAPLLLDSAATGRAWRLDWPGGSLTVDRGGVAEAGVRIGGPAAVSVSAIGTGPKTRPAGAEGREVPSEAWAVLDKLAANTLVPETPESRARGAGDGGRN